MSIMDLKGSLATVSISFYRARHSYPTMLDNPQRATGVPWPNSTTTWAASSSCLELAT